MKRVVIFSVLALLVIGTIGCGPEVKKETIYADKAPSVSVSTPTTTWTVGDLEAIQWSSDTNSEYNLEYYVYFYLAPHENTEVNNEYWDNGTQIDPQTGRYFLGMLTTPKIINGGKGATYSTNGEKGASYATVPPNLPAGKYKLMIELTHYEYTTNEATVLAVGESDYFNISPDATPTPLITTRETFVSTSTATISGKVKTSGIDTMIWVEYGKIMMDYNTDSIIISAASSPTDVTISISNLEPATNYYYRIVAQNSYGVVYSYLRGFRTK